MARERQSYDERLIHWGEKISRDASLSFAPTVGRWAVHLLDELDQRPDATAEAEDMASLAVAVGVPGKYLSRALAVTGGLVSFNAGPPVRIVLHRKRLLKAKNAAEKTRGRIPASLRARLFEQDRHRCGHCGKEFAADELVVDHVIPLALRGADEPGNWVALCKPDNREKWLRFSYGFIRYYRGEPVVGSIGVRFRDGFFWPHVNGRTRLDRRSDWV